MIYVYAMLILIQVTWEFYGLESSNFAIQLTM